jgi:hypothetical protein
MKPRSRTPDGRFAREVPDGMIDAVALGTVAAGLVVGAADHLPAANARPADHHAAPAVVPPLPEAAAAAAAPVAPSHGAVEAGPAVPHFDGPAEKAAVTQTHSVELDRPAALDDPVALESSVAAPSAPAEGQHIDAAPPLHETLASIADTFSSAMKTLVDHVQVSTPEPDHLSSVLQHLGTMADSAVALAGEIVPTSMPALPELPALSPITSISATVDHVLDAVALPSLPAMPSVPQVLDHVLGAPSLPDLPALHTDLPASVLGAAEATFDHLVAPIVEAAPLQIGFLGQSYTEVGDPHDPGSHGMTSMLHGLV